MDQPWDQAPKHGLTRPPRSAARQHPSMHPTKKQIKIGKGLLLQSPNRGGEFFIPPAGNKSSCHIQPPIHLQNVNVSRAMNGGVRGSHGYETHSLAQTSSAGKLMTPEKRWEKLSADCHYSKRRDRAEFLLPPPTPTPSRQIALSLGTSGAGERGDVWLASILKRFL